MINFIDKGCGLHERLRDRGCAIHQLDGVWESGNPVAAQAIIDSYPLADTRAEVCARINAHARALRDAAVAGISPAEMAGWAIKRAEAAAYTASGNAADAPVLAAEAAARGVTLSAIVLRVSANALALAMLEAAIAGVSGKHRDAVNALGTFGAVLGYDYSAGWPVLP